MKSSGTACLGALFRKPEANNATPAFREEEDADCTMLADLVRECEAGRSAFSFLGEWSPLLRVKVRLLGRSFLGLSGDGACFFASSLLGHWSSNWVMTPVFGLDELGLEEVAELESKLF